MGMIVHIRSSLPLLSQLLMLGSVYSLLSPKNIHHVPHNHNHAPPHCCRGRTHLSDSPSTLISTEEMKEEEDSSLQTPTKSMMLEQINLNNQLSSYSFHWESLLTKEYQDTVADFQQRRKSYTRSQLEASGLALFNAVATPETELYGEKIVRISLLQQSHQHDNSGAGNKKLREKFKRGDVLVMTAEMLFRGKEVAPREGLVMDVGRDFLTLGVGTTWPAGVMEMRKQDNYRVRLDRSLSNVPLRAQRMALEKLRKGGAGYAADALVQLYYDSSAKYLDVAREMPSHFVYGENGTFDEQVNNAMEDAMSRMSFKPNKSQQKAVSWALKRKMALIRGPPGMSTQS